MKTGIKRHEPTASPTWIGLGDGSVVFISETTDMSVLLRYAVRNDGQANCLDCTVDLECAEE